jgi:hypothetical protein
MSKVKRNNVKKGYDVHGNKTKEEAFVREDIFISLKPW